MHVEFCCFLRQEDKFCIKANKNFADDDENIGSGEEEEDEKEEDLSQFF